MTAPAHIVSTSGLPGLVGWLVAAVLAVAVAVAVLGRGRRLRATGLVVAVAAGGTTVVLWTYTTSTPTAPGYVLALSSPAAGSDVTSPVTVVVCGRTPDGAPAVVPGSGRLVSMSVDGRQVAERADDTVILEIPTGSHRIRVEVLTTDHRQFSPPLAIETSIVVVGVGPASNPRRC